MVIGRGKLPAGVKCALMFREETSFLVGEGGLFTPDRGGGVDANSYGSQLNGLNVLISVTARVESC